MMGWAFYGGHMKAKIVNRMLLAFWLIYLPIAQLGATGSYEQAGAAFLILLVTAWLGWMERDNTKVGAGDTATKPLREMTDADFDEAHGS
jgi:hypothetical protein